MKNESLTVKLEDDKEGDDYDKAKTMKTKPSHFGGNVLSHSKWLMSNFKKQKGGFCNDSIYYIDTDPLLIRRKHWSSLVDNGFLG